MSKAKPKSMEQLLEEALVPKDEQPYEVPGNWVWVRLGRIVKINPPKPKLEYGDDHICSFLPMSAVDPVEGKIAYLEERPFHSVKKGYTYFEENDILFAKITPCMENGNSVITEGLLNGFGFGSTEFYVIRTPKTVDNRYIYYLVRSERFRKQAKNVMAGAVGQQRVPKFFLEEYPIALPPLNEQKRIADKIERLFAKIDEAKRLIEEVKESIEQRRAVMLEKAFKGQLGTNDPSEKSILETSDDLSEKDVIPKEQWPYEVPGNWVWVRSGHVAKWGSGGTPSRKRLEYYGGDIPWIKTGELNDGIITGSEETITEEGLQKSSAKIFPKGSIVIAMYGATIGRLGILGIDAATNQACAVGQPYEFLDSKYMFYYFFARRSDLVALGKGGAQPNISQTIIKDFPFALPPLNEQKRIAEKLDNLLEKLENEKQLVLAAEEKLDLVKQSVLQKAFRGELGTNDPNDGHAMELVKEALLSSSGQR
ncbi:restriction endonuclease subunit S [Geobacillus sp. YHL]|uniref:restriction endonuclease subunit S n=1 Tax=Geobacillus sp. YHL TaxID=2796117 RepID=UPI001EEFD114|nr:restriction endonuclease subunit S [Geobacillus sp. YHL]MCG6794483.1 restriction endonuclease subunit S [Geobacillus sp. YHL]